MSKKKNNQYTTITYVCFALLLLLLLNHVFTDNRAKIDHVNQEKLLEKYQLVGTPPFQRQQTVIPQSRFFQPGLSSFPGSRPRSTFYGQGATKPSVIGLPKPNPNLNYDSRTLTIAIPTNVSQSLDPRDLYSNH